MKKWIFLLIVIVLLTILVGINTYKNAFDYQREQTKKATLVAMKTEPDLEISEVAFYNGTSSYTIIYGEINHNKRIVCVPTNELEKVIVVNPDKGISKEEALKQLQQEQNPLEIKSVNLGIEQNIPIWEIVYLDQNNRYSYYYVTFKDGQFIKRYTL
ncbi:PepSY domain-containing protein [Bacillus sp. DJP31]|uniref:PepSY domain-containing protein n=1 Tax=Bacillus sp. DJP31 TaxID=3409789 RepID=UPI003BB633F7